MASISGNLLPSVLKYRSLSIPMENSEPRSVRVFRLEVVGVAPMLQPFKTNAKCQQVTLKVCEDYAGAKLSDISQEEKIKMRMRIKDDMRKKRLPRIDDEAIEWRISKCLPELRVKKRGT